MNEDSDLLGGSLSLGGSVLWMGKWSRPQEQVVIWRGPYGTQKACTKGRWAKFDIGVLFDMCLTKSYKAPEAASRGSAWVWSKHQLPVLPKAQATCAGPTAEQGRGKLLKSAEYWVLSITVPLPRLPFYSDSVETELV